MADKYWTRERLHSHDKPQPLEEVATPRLILELADRFTNSNALDFVSDTTLRNLNFLITSELLARADIKWAEKVAARMEGSEA